MGIGHLAQRAREEKGLPPYGATAEPDEPLTEPAPASVPLTVDPRDARIAQLETLMQQLLEAKDAPGPATLPGAPVTVIQTDVRYPQNPNYNEISPFTEPEGQRHKPKPVLHRETFFCGIRQRDDDLTPKEVRLFNAFQEGITKAATRQWRALVSMNGTRQLCHIECVESSTIDGRLSLPSLSEVLETIHGGAVTMAPGAARDEFVLAQLAELSRQMATLQKLVTPAA